MAKSKFITAYLLRVDEETGKPYKGYLAEVENSLEAEQLYVNHGREGGTIQVIEMDGIDYILNDEGKLLGLPNNRVVIGDGGEVLEFFAGNIMCVRHNSAGDFTSIHESDIAIIENRLKPIFSIIGRTILLSLNDDLPEYKEDESSGHSD